MTRDSHAGVPPPIGGEVGAASQAREADTGRPGPPAALHGRLLHVARMATIGEMATGIAHELNQPLTAIANYAQACKRPPRTDIRLATPASPGRGADRRSPHRRLRAADIIRQPAGRLLSVQQGPASSVLKISTC